MARESIFTLEATPIKFGPGAVDDAGWELGRLGVSPALLVTDPGVAAAGHAETVRASLTEAGIAVVMYDRSRVEPTLDSLQAAADFALEAGVDGFVSVGGGSAIDTAKVASLIVFHPAPAMDYVNAPVGGGVAVPGPLRPHLAIPTTCGTGSEATTVAVLDIPERRVKTGISHRYLRPSQAIVDPALAASLPSEVVASAGLDVICHAAESFLSLPYTERERPPSPRPAPALPGREPGGRRVVVEGAGVRRALPAPRGRVRCGRRRARSDDARRVDGGRRLRLGGRAHPARVRLPDRRPQARVHAAGLPGRPPVRPARDLGDCDLAGGVPVHVRGRPGAPRARRGPARLPTRPASTRCRTP